MKLLEPRAYLVAQSMGNIARLKIIFSSQTATNIFARMRGVDVQQKPT
jgi:hypothetical protein